MNKAKKGQIAILLALSFSLLWLLAAMVVNIGFLVTAKINLQNATDLAAYSGAIQQARFLTEIGKWNYEMRRNYKAMAYDFVIAYNAERKESDFKRYINNTGVSDDYTPLICAGLQRQADISGPLQLSGLEGMCQRVPYDQFENLIDRISQTIDSSREAVNAACPGLACATYTAMLAQLFQQGIQTVKTAHTYDEKYHNYVDNQHNYNRRLIGWTLHAYRHLQARIRGVHYGTISNINSRWDLEKNTKDRDDNIFLNSPISVAAKVINGFTNPGELRPPLPDAGGLIELEGELLKNPVHNAAYTSFRNNLINVIPPESARIYSITPAKPPSTGAATSDMAGGCNERCNEYNGHYLRLQQHDLNFLLSYVTIINLTTGGGDLSLASVPIFNFPVGVAKDRRVLTYYAVLGTADTEDIPFKVFFAENAPRMIAVAAARPFGSRIGPFIDERCDYTALRQGQASCIANGLDPLYPSRLLQDYPNFSIRKEPGLDSRRLGVKLTVDSLEHGRPQQGPMVTTNPHNFTDLFGKTYGPRGRARFYVRPGNYTKDDGHNSDPLQELHYYDRDANPIPPQGSKNSIFAWNPRAEAVTGDAIGGFSAGGGKDSFEDYLRHFKGQVVESLSSGQTMGARQVRNQDYNVYVFRYPDRIESPTPQGSWDILGLTTPSDYRNSMERSFANTMAVNEFEIRRYIIPYHTDEASRSVLNYITNDANNPAFIHSGAHNRGFVSTGTAMQQGGGNKRFSEYLQEEPRDVLNATGKFPEFYTAWRIGSRGYRAKLVNIQELLQGAGHINHLPQSINVDGITINLSQINY